MATPPKDLKELLWKPSPGFADRTRLAEFMRWLEAERGVVTGDYESLWRWSVTDLPGFWRAIWDFFGVAADGLSDGRDSQWIGSGTTV